MRARWLACAALVFVAGIASAAPKEKAPPAKAPAESSPTERSPAEVWIRGKAGKLQAWLWRPAGPGPFPAIVYNHGSEAQPVVGTESQIGTFFVAHGYAVLFPYRRGAGKSEGRFWGDEVDQMPEAKQEQGTIDRLLLENDDVVTAIEWMRAQPWVARDDISVGGCSFGGIETLFTAERPVPGLRAAFDFAGGSMAWSDNPLLRERLLRAVESARVPIFFVQAENDFNTAPSKILSEAMRAKKLPYRVRIFPHFGLSQMGAHAGFCMYGWDVWGDDVLDFLRQRR